MAVKLIIDAGCDLNADQARKLNVILIPMTIRFGDEEYRAGIDISSEDFYNKLAISTDLPTTSQPTPYEYECAYQQITDCGDEAVVLCVSSALSGTFQSATIAAANYNNVYIVDTQAVSVAQKILLDYAILLRDRNMSAKDIAAHLEIKKKDVCIYGAVETLEYLIKGGRLSKTAGTVGSVLGIRPILHLEDGVLEVAGKARGVKAAITMTHSFIEKIGVDFSMPCGLGYTGNDPQAIVPFRNVPNSQWDSPDVPVYQVGSTVGTHAGPGLFLAAFFKKS